MKKNKVPGNTRKTSRTFLSAAHNSSDDHGCIQQGDRLCGERARLLGALYKYPGHPREAGGGACGDRFKGWRSPAGWCTSGVRFQ